MRKTGTLILTSLIAVSCTVGPDYERPKVQAPTVYRGPTPGDDSKTDQTTTQADTQQAQDEDRGSKGPRPQAPGDHRPDRRAARPAELLPDQLVARSRGS